MSATDSTPTSGSDQLDAPIMPTSVYIQILRMFTPEGNPMTMAPENDAARSLIPSFVAYANALADLLEAGVEAGISVETAHLVHGSAEITELSARYDAFTA